MKQYDLAVVIGRFQPLHNGHVHLISKAKKLAKSVLILVGSASSPRSIRNPWTYSERKLMIEIGAIQGLSGFLIKPLFDHLYNDEAWMEQVQNEINSLEMNKVVIVGHDKDESSYYMHLFPQYDVIEVESHKSINATNIRHMMFSVGEWKQFVPINIRNQLMNGFLTTDAGSELIKEYYYLYDYMKLWDDAPYDPTFVTVDAVVVCSGHVLVVERGEFPGKGLLALPGGFLNQKETLLNGALRELKEETRLKMPIPALKGVLKRQHVFDHPNRSMRGRTITHGFFFHLEPGKLPEVRGGDDAAKAFWLPLSEVDQKDFFEDHYHIIRYFV